jgi:hypothetical protein
MFSFKSFKLFAGFTVLFASSCSFWQAAQRQNADVSGSVSQDNAKSAIPFFTKEPDVYQAEIVLTNYANGEKTMRKIFTARSGAKMRIDFENRISFLQPTETERFSLYNAKKIYTENQIVYGDSARTDDESSALKDFLATEWLNEKRTASFENRVVENGLIKYTIKLENAPDASSEALIFVDEKLNFPVRQEFYTINGEQQSLIFSMELRNLKLEADDKLFELPKDYRKISSNEFQKTIRQEKIDSKNE